MFRRVLHSQTKTITFAALLLAVSSLISRALGLLRDRLLAGRFGAGEELDIYFAAFRIPDFVYGILIAGAITAAFLPVFSEYFKDGGGDKKWPKEALEFTNNVLNTFLLLLIIACGVLALLAPFLIKFIIPGFSPESRELTITLTRIMFFSPILFGLSSIFSGILHYFDRFLVYSLAPIFYNVGIIVGILFFVPYFGVYGLAYGVILGAFLHMAIQIPSAKFSGYKYKYRMNFGGAGLRKIFKLMVPRIIGSTAYHVNLVVITAIASTLTVGSIAVFTFSNNLQHFPIGIIGISFAVSSFPILSRIWTRGDKEQFLESFSSSFRQILFFIVPISFLMFLLRAQLVRLILGTGEFGWLETRLTAASLGVFCIGILAASLIPLVVRAFFALHDTKTPVTISIGTMGLNVGLSFLFVYLLGFTNAFSNFTNWALKLEDIADIKMIGLPLALSLAAVFQLVFLLIYLYKKIGDYKIREIIQSFSKILIASVVMIIFAYSVRQMFSDVISAKFVWGIFAQTSLSILIGFVIYFSMTVLLKSPEIKVIKKSLLKQFDE